MAGICPWTICACAGEEAVSCVESGLCTTERVGMRVHKVLVLFLRCMANRRVPCGPVRTAASCAESAEQRSDATLPGHCVHIFVA